MANIGHNHEDTVGSGYDATSDAPIAGWDKVAQTNTAVDHTGQANSAGPWKQV